jgi:hypothetical protein
MYIKKFISLKPNPKEMNIILNILKGAQFEFLPRAPFYIDTPLVQGDQALAKRQKMLKKIENSSTKTVAEQSMNSQTPLGSVMEFARS